MAKQVILFRKLTILSFAFGIIMIACCKKTDVITPSVYFPEVKTIIQQNCISCHFYPEGQGLPIVLTEDSDIVNYAAAIKAATCDPSSPQNKHMPLGGDLSDEDKITITSWFANGGTASD